MNIGSETMMLRQHLLKLYHTFLAFSTQLVAHPIDETHIVEQPPFIFRFVWDLLITEMDRNGPEYQEIGTIYFCLE